MLVEPASELVEGFREMDVSGVSIFFTAWGRCGRIPRTAIALPILY
jgi:hypothetical protein